MEKKKKEGGSFVEIFTVGFSGHRIVERPGEIENGLFSLLRPLIRQKEYLDFLVGCSGDFDRMAASCVRQVVREYGEGNASLILHLPYLTASCRENRDYYLAYYDEIEIYDASAGAHFKAAFEIRNRALVDRSDLLICYLRKESGGVFRAVDYAKKRGKQVVNLADGCGDLPE